MMVIMMAQPPGHLEVKHTAVETEPLDSNPGSSTDMPPRPGVIACPVSAQLTHR